MKKYIATIIAAVALSSASPAAADRPGPIFNWSGSYVGLNGGFGSSAASNQLFNPLFPTDTSVDPSGAFGGVQIGFNWQGVGSRWVVGIEADIQASGIKDDTISAGATFSSDLKWFGTLRGRLGYAFNRTLVYGTGGFAYGNVDNAATGGIGGGPFISDRTATGYVLGAGIEYVINPAWTAKVEYQYMNLGKNDPTNAGGVPFSSFGTVKDDAFHTLRLGLNYKFGSR